MDLFLRMARIRWTQHRRGERLDAAYRQWSSPEYRPLDTATSFVMTSLLENVVKNGTAVAASRIGFPVAGKTGTTNDSYDAWFMGYSSNLVTGVWVGHDTKGATPWYW